MGGGRDGGRGRSFELREGGMGGLEVVECCFGPVGSIEGVLVDCVNRLTFLLCLNPISLPCQYFCLDFGSISFGSFI